ncbi:MAG: 30S ribosomal protein S8 [Simkaniaceae bacterium]|nr:30S ribosomal protein S8 [Simkaniaceae bacterium]MCF7851881.1 30S ribosomal protein S8 [Simkaniaceae bacterium]
MSLSDPIADLLTRIRNAALAKHRYVDIYLSKLKRSVVEVLKEAGFVENFLIDEEKGRMRIFLKYTKSKECLISGLKRYSKPGVRKYVGYKDIPNVMEGLGLSILSTSKGVMSGTKAKHEKVGGELLCCIW